MSKVIDISGNRYGRVVVLSFDSVKDESAYWLCQCDCGNQAILRGNSLKQGKTKSCGCFLKEVASIKGKNSSNLPKGVASGNSLFSTYKHNAKDRNIQFNISRDLFFTITQQNCHYCGRPPKSRYNPKSCNGDYIYNGIDRINNSMGYESNNIVPCCKICNIAKHTLSIEEFKLWVIDVYNNFASK